MTAFDRVLAAPSSLAARRALLAEWTAAGDPRAELLAKQLAYRNIPRRDWSTPEAREIDRTLTRLIMQHGDAWSNGVAGLVESYKYRRGLVAVVKLSGEAFLARGDELFKRAPIQHVDLTAPLGSVKALASCPFVGHLSSLHIENLGAAFGDAEATELAAGSEVAALSSISLWYDQIGDAGVKAIAASPHLMHTKYIGFVGNPVDPTPTVDDHDGEYTASRPALAEVLEKTYGKRPWLAVPMGNLADWPPDRDELAVLP